MNEDSFESLEGETIIAGVFGTHRGTLWAPGGRERWRLPNSDFRFRHVTYA